MKLSEQSKEDITDDVIESRDVEEDDLTTAYLKGYADAEEKYRKKIKELEEENEELLEVKISCSAVNIIENLQKENKSKQKAYDDCYCEYKKYKQFDSIPVQKVKDYLKEEKERYEVYKKESETNETLKLGMWKHLGAKNMCEKILGIEKNIATLD